MSYDCYIVHPDTRETLLFKGPHQLRGGTYALGGTNEAWVNITYNYGGHLRKALGPDGLMGLNRMPVGQALTLISQGLGLLGDDIDDDYWKPTEGNAKLALIDLGSLCMLAIREGYSDYQLEIR